jgi:hypothetical protein
LTATSIGTGIVEASSIAPAETTYPADGKLHNAEPAPYTPAGGVGTNGSIPVYNAKSDFDYESLVCIFFYYVPHWILSGTDFELLGSRSIPRMD